MLCAQTFDVLRLNKTSVDLCVISVHLCVTIRTS